LEALFCYFHALKRENLNNPREFMILNKFSSVSYFRLRTFSLQLLAISLFSCNKTANINANKSFVSITHLAYGVGPLTVAVNGSPLFSGTLAFSNTTGDSLNPYDTTTSRISELMVNENSNTLLSGNASFEQLGQYSIFVYDTLNSKSVSLVTLQNNQTIIADTVTYIRYLNFSPGSYLGLKLINTRKFNYASDTVIIDPVLFIGYDPNPASYNFFTVHIGNYNVFAYADSSMPNLNPNHDTSKFRFMGLLKLDSMINYNVYLQGFVDSVSATDSLQLRSFRVN
jgi:hypothetical protein